MKKIIPLLCFVLISFCIAGQSFSYQYGPGLSTNYNASVETFKITHTNDGGHAFVTTARDSAATNNSFRVVKTDFAGNVQWAFTYDAANANDYPLDIIQLPDSSLAITGTSGASSKIYYWHLSTSGALISAKAYSDTTPFMQLEVNSLRLSGEGNLMFGGVNRNEHFAMKTTIAGNIIWAKSFRHNLPNHYARTTRVLATSDGGILLAGNYKYEDTIPGPSPHPLDSFDLEIIKLDSSGNLQWFRQLGHGSTLAYPFSLCETSTGDFLIGGEYTDYPSFEFLLKIGLAGNVKWFKSIVSGAGDPDFFISEKSNGSYIVGTTLFGPRLVTVDTSGNVSTVGMYNYSSPYILSTVTATLSQDSGVTFYGSDYSNLYLIKTNNLFQASCNSTNTVWSSFNIPFILDTVINASNPVISFQDVTPTFTVTPVVVSVTNICQPTATEALNQDHSSFFIFPNPSSGKCFVRTAEINSTLTFLNNLGQIIYQQNIVKPETEIDFSAMRTGIYFYLLTTQDGIKASGKLAVE